MENKTFKSTPFTPEQQQWIAEQEAIMRQENLTSAIEELTNEVTEFRAAINNLNNMLFALVNTLDKK